MPTLQERYKTGRDVLWALLNSKTELSMDNLEQSIAILFVIIYCTLCCNRFSFVGQYNFVIATAGYVFFSPKFYSLHMYMIFNTRNSSHLHLAVIHHMHFLSMNGRSIVYDVELG
jgi:hypothetical protein